MGHLPRAKRDHERAAIRPQQRPARRVHRGREGWRAGDSRVGAGLRRHHDERGIRQLPHPRGIQMGREEMAAARGAEALSRHGHSCIGALASTARAAPRGCVRSSATSWNAASGNGGQSPTQWWTSRGARSCSKRSRRAVSRRESGRDVHPVAARRAAVHDERRHHLAARSRARGRVERVRSHRVGKRWHSSAQRRSRARGHESALQGRGARGRAVAREDSASIRGRGSFLPQSRGATDRRKSRRRCSSTFRRARRARTASCRCWPMPR